MMLRQSQPEPVARCAMVVSRYDRCEVRYMTESEKINPYASPTTDSDPSFRDMLRDQRAAALFERRRRSAICMLIGTCGVVLATLVFNVSQLNNSPSLPFGTIVMLTSLGLFFFGQTVWTWIQPIQK